MISDIQANFINMIDIANIAAETYTKTKANSAEEAMLSLTLQGEFDLLDSFEKGLKYINENKEYNYR